MHERARLLFHLGRYTLAREELARTLAADPGDPWSHALLALCLAGQREWDEALSAAEEAIRTGPDEPFCNYARAYVLRGRGLPVPAALSAQESIRIQPDYLQGWVLLGEIRLDQEDYRDAARCAREGLAGDPENRGCLAVLATALMEMGYDRETRGVTEDLLRIAPEYANAHALEAWRLLYRLEHDAAIARFHEALRLDPDLDIAVGGLRRAEGENDPFNRAFQRVHGPLIRRVNRLNPHARWLPTLVIIYGELFAVLFLFTALGVVLFALDDL